MRGYIYDFSREYVSTRQAIDGFDVFSSAGTESADLIVRLPVGAFSVRFLMRKSSNNYIGENT